MKGIPRQTYIRKWEGDLPEIGDYLLTRGGTLYAVIQIKKLREDRKSVAAAWIWRLDPDDVDPAKRVHNFYWTPRTSDRV